MFKKLTSFIVTCIGRIHWQTKRSCTAADLATIHGMLTHDYYIILTHRSNHLSTFFICLATFFMTGHWGYWAHVLMNTEDEVKDINDFRLIEAVGNGVTYSPFNEVFNVQGVALLKPKNMSLDRWTAVLDKAKMELGKPYDTLFNLIDDKQLSCVELIRDALMAEPDYKENFANFESMISKYKNLTPDMFYRCSDFEMVFEIKA